MLLLGMLLEISSSCSGAADAGLAGDGDEADLTRLSSKPQLQLCTGQPQPAAGRGCSVRGPVPHLQHGVGGLCLAGSCGAGGCIIVVVAYFVRLSHVSRLSICCHSVQSRHRSLWYGRAWMFHPTVAAATATAVQVLQGCVLTGGSCCCTVWQLPCYRPLPTCEWGFVMHIKACSGA